MVAELSEKCEKLLSELAILDEIHKPELHSPDQRLLLISGILETLRHELTEYIFSGYENEIRFFKETFPDFLSLFIYYTEKSALETSALIGTRKSRTEYRNRLVKRIDDFSTENAALYEYYSLRKTDFDSYYFLRNSPMNREPAILFGTVIDCKICPGYSIKMAMISAYRKLDQELSDHLSSDTLKGSEISSFISGLRWTGSKRDLTEVIYSIPKYVNNGQVTIKEIVHGVQTLFNIDLGNHSRAYQEILSRKKGESFFLNQLLNDQQRKIEEIENEQLRRRGFK